MTSLIQLGAEQSDNEDNYINNNPIGDCSDATLSQLNAGRSDTPPRRGFRPMGGAYCYLSPVGR